jgi:hypothetical protein
MGDMVVKNLRRRSRNCKPRSVQEQAALLGLFYDFALSRYVPVVKVRRSKGAVKLLLLLNHYGYLPSFPYVSNGKRHDVTMARKIHLASGSIGAMDRACNDYGLFASWTTNKIFFVTRMKRNADYRVVGDLKVRNIARSSQSRSSSSQERTEDPCEVS